MRITGQSARVSLKDSFIAVRVCSQCLFFIIVHPKNYYESIYKLLFCTCRLHIKMTIIRFNEVFCSLFCYSACPAGKYRSEDDTTCQLCPNNTVTDQEAAPDCECLNGYFRYKADVNRPNVSGITWPSSDEGPSVGCSRESHGITSKIV